MNLPPSERLAADATQHQWFLEEVHPHETSLKNYVRRAFPAVRDFEDVVQDSYLRVWQRQQARPIAAVTGAVQASVRGFLFQVARRLALDRLRRERASPIDADDAAISSVADSADVHATVCIQQEFQLVLDAIDRLPARCREIVVLRKLQHLPPARIAARLGISEETVHVQTRRGLQRIQKFLRARGVIREGRT